MSESGGVRFDPTVDKDLLGHFLASFLSCFTTTTYFQSVIELSAGTEADILTTIYHVVKL